MLTHQQNWQEVSELFIFWKVCFLLNTNSVSVNQMHLGNAQAISYESPCKNHHVFNTLT